MYRAGDVIFVRHSGWISRLIRKVVCCDYNHVGIFINDCEIVEATFKGVALSNLSKFEDGVCSGVVEKFVVLRPSSLTEEQCNTAAAYAVGMVGAKYDFILLFSLFVFFILNVSRRLEPVDVDNAWVCSELVSEAFYEAGFRFYENVDPDNITPADLFYSPFLEVL